jgi:DNA polymerase III sliding clamp (beta) subunit (PCNA family)
VGTGERFDAPKQNQTKLKQMKLNKIHKLESACSRDENRSTITQPFIQGGRSIATDGKILASVPIETDEGEEVEDKRIPIDALKAARKATLKMYPDATMTLGEKSCSLPNGASYPVLHPEHEGSRIPRVAEIVSARLTKEDAAFSVALDITLLEKLSEAIGCEKVTLCFRDNKSIITVLPHDANGAFGLLMPMRTE